MSNRILLRLFIAGVALVCLSVGPAYSQDDLRRIVVRDWKIASAEEKAYHLAKGMESTEPEKRALALSGIAMLAAENPLLARESVDIRAIRESLDYADADVLSQAMTALLLMEESDERAETAIIERALRGGGPLSNVDYVRYLRPKGITSASASAWLLRMATGPISTEKFVAAEALVLGPEEPPQRLLPELMALIQSKEFFCHPNLVQFLPEFGSAAALHLEELKRLRPMLLDMTGSSSSSRAGSRVGGFDLAVLDKTISTLESPSLK